MWEDLLAKFKILSRALSPRLPTLESVLKTLSSSNSLIPDSEIGWFEALVSKKIGYELGINRNIQAIIWDTKVTENHFVELYRNIKYKQLRITFRDSKPNKNWVLPTALIKNYFGDYTI